MIICPLNNACKPLCCFILIHDNSLINNWVVSMHTNYLKGCIDPNWCLMEVREVKAVPPSGDSLEVAICSFSCATHGIWGGGGRQESAKRADRCGLVKKDKLHKVLLYCKNVSPRPRCYPELLRVKKRSVSRNSAPARSQSWYKCKLALTILVIIRWVVCLFSEVAVAI